MRGACQAEVSRLLDFYVNGTLRDPERARVGEHLETCAACAREAAEIAELGRLLREAGPETVARPARSPARLLMAVAALLAVAVVGVWFAMRTALQPSSDSPQVVALDLGAGGARGGPPPTASIALDTESIEVSFSLTVEPGAVYVLRLYGPEGEPVFGPAEVAGWDALGSAHQRIPAPAFAIDGNYRLELEESPEGQASRFYEYEFIVRRDR